MCMGVLKTAAEGHLNPKEPTPGSSGPQGCATCAWKVLKAQPSVVVSFKNLAPARAPVPNVHGVGVNCIGLV